MSKLTKGKGPIFGVCGGISDYVGLDVTIVRVLFAVTSLFFFIPIVAYFILAIAMPKRSKLERGDDLASIPSSSGLIFCKSCGEENVKEGKFCRNCGEQLKV